MGAVFAYTSVSTVRQGEKGVSLSEQKDSITRYGERNGLEITRWFEERESAATTGRPAFSQMLKLLRLGVAKGVIIHKIDRSARNLHDWVDVGKLVDAGVDVHFATESLDLKTVAGRLSADIQAVVAAHYSRNLREEVKKGIVGRLKQGYYPFRAPIGYLDQGAAKPKIPDPVIAPLVIKTFELYDTGRYSEPQLAREMYARGLRNRNGAPVTVNGVSRMLNNLFYMGVMPRKSTGELFEGRHEPLIGRELLERVQARLRGKTVDRVARHEFTYSRLVRCSSCRYSLIAERKKGHTYYRCHNRPFKNPPVCPTTNIREDRLEEVVLAELAAVELAPKELEFARQWIKASRTHTEDDRRQQLQALQLGFQQVQSQLSSLADLLLNGTVDETVYREKQNTLLVRQADLKQKMQHGGSELDNAVAKLESTVELLKSPSLLYKSAPAAKKRELLKILLSNLTVSGKNVEITLRIPFQIIAERQKSTKCGPNRETCRTLAELLRKLYSFFAINTESAS